MTEEAVTDSTRTITKGTVNINGPAPSQSLFRYENTPLPHILPVIPPSGSKIRPTDNEKPQEIWDSVADKPSHKISKTTLKGYLSKDDHCPDISCGPGVRSEKISRSHVYFTVAKKYHLPVSPEQTSELMKKYGYLIIQ